MRPGTSRANAYGEGNLRALLSALDSTSKLVYDLFEVVVCKLTFFLVSYMPLALEAAGRRMSAHYEHESSY